MQPKCNNHSQKRHKPDEKMYNFECSYISRLAVQVVGGTVFPLVAISTLMKMSKERDDHHDNVDDDDGMRDDE